MGRPVASRAGSPGVVACRMPRHSSSPRRASVPTVRAAVTAARPEPSPPTGEPHCAHSTVCSRPLCYRAATDADQPRAAPAPSKSAPGPPQGASWLDHRSSRHRRPHRLPEYHPPCGWYWPRRGRRRLQPLLRQPPRPRRGAPEPGVRPADARRRPDGQDRARQARLAPPEVVTYDQIPGEMIDATTSIEDQGFWQNAGFDPVGIISAGVDTISGRPRGASTITQQLVRARLLPDWAFEGSTYERKLREIIQSVRLTQEYPGQSGKEQIITAYLNQNFYGNNSYGVKAAAKSYFGKDLDDLSLAQYAILAAIPQSPTKFDLVKNADEICRTTVADDADCPAFDLIVPDTKEIVIRRNHVLDLMKT